MGPNAAYPPPERQEYYPATNNFPPPPNTEQFPPPPTEEYRREADYPPQEYPPYNPADYAPPGGTPAPNHPNRTLDDRYTEDPNPGYPPANETYAGDPRYHEPGRGRPGPENVSARPSSAVDEHDLPGGFVPSSHCGPLLLQAC